MALTESQLLLLNNLIYRSEVTKTGACDKTLEDIVKMAKANNVRPQQEMTTDEWKDIFDLIEKDDTLKQMKIVSINQERETGARMACFVDPEGNAYAVFAGTGSNEWRDDCVAGTMADSPQQIKARAWFDSLPYENITVSGHSKGGNKAMYIAVTSDKAGECYAFDGEGFSNEFCEKYADRIAARKDRIHLRANSRDFVNILLNYVAGDIKYVHNEEGISGPGEYHCPNAMLKYIDGKPTGEIGPLTDYQDPTMEMFHNFSVFLLNNATEAEKILALSVLGELLTEFLGGSDKIVREDIIDQFGTEGLEIIIRYLTLYLKQLYVSDPLTYLKYRHSFEEFVYDAPNNFWSFVLRMISARTLSLISPGTLFDLIAGGTIERLYRTASYITGGNVRARDFSEDVKQRMLNAARETEEEPWWRVDRWDCWYRVEQFFGGMRWDQYTGRVDEYYRKLIDINDASVRDIETIFNRVYGIDASVQGTINERISEATQIGTELQALADAVNPIVVVNPSGCIPQKAYLPVTPIKSNPPGRRGPEVYQEVMHEFDVAHNPRYQPRNGNTWCNIYVWDVTTAMGCEIPHYYNRTTGAPMTRDEAIQHPNSYFEMSAPRMTQWLETHGARYGWVECDADTAIQMANEGMPTVTAATDTGHVAMVAPQRNGDSGVMVSQAGARNFEIGRQQDGFGNHHVKYFYHI